MMGVLSPMFRCWRVTRSALGAAIFYRTVNRVPESASRHGSRCLLPCCPWGKSSNPRAQATKQTVRDREFGGQTGLWIPYKCSTFAIGQLYFTIFYTLLSKFSEHFRINLSLILSVTLREKGPRMFKATSATYWQYMAIWAEYRWQMMATYCSLRLTPSMPSSFASSPSERPVDAEQQKRRGLNTKRSNEQNMTQSTARIARIARKKRNAHQKGHNWEQRDAIEGYNW